MATASADNNIIDVVSEGPKFLTINLNSSKKGSRVANRREEVKKVIHVQPKYDLIFAQEIPAPKSEATKLDMKPEEYGSLTPTKEAGLFWSTERLELIESKANDPVLKQEVRYSVSTSNRGAQLNTRATAAVFKVSIEGTPPYTLLAISWHGPNNNYMDIKISPEVRRDLFILLQKFAIELKTKVESESDYTISIDDIIIGGDFNVDLARLDDALEGDFKICVCQDGEKNIMGFLYDSGSRPMMKPEKFQVHGLDHEAVKVELQVTQLRSVSNLKMGPLTQRDAAVMPDDDDEDSEIEISNSKFEFENEDEDDEDEMYLKSLVPDMKALDDKKKCFLKSCFQQLIFAARFGDLQEVQSVFQSQMACLHSQNATASNQNAASKKI